MALLISSPGTNIMDTRAASDLRALLQRRINGRLTRLKPDRQLALLGMLRGELNTELSFEERFTASLSELYEQLERATDAAELATVAAAFPSLATEHFQRRGSVCALQTLCTTFRVRLLQKALTLAEASPRPDAPDAPLLCYTILAAGCSGRREQSLSGGSAYYLIYDGWGSREDDHFSRLSTQLVEVLRRCGLLLDTGPSQFGDIFWHGSIVAWQALVQERLQPPAPPHWRSLPVLPTLTAPNPLPSTEEGYGQMIETLADLRPVAGDQTLAASLKEFANNRLKHELVTGTFLHLAKRIAMMPVARGIFGWFRVALSGEHRGEFDMEQLALAPLIANVRLLAINCGLQETNTVARVKALQGRGDLSVELAERILHAYQDFASLKVLRQITGECEDEQACFIDPKGLPDNGEQRLRNGLEALSVLEKITYHKFTEHA